MPDAKPLLSVSEPLGRALEIVRSNLQRDDAPLQHVLVVAPRGGGKTTFLRALSEAIAADRDLGTRAAVANVGALEVGTAGPDHYIDRLAAAFDRSILQMTLNFGQFDEASWIAALGRLDKAHAKSVRGRRWLGVLLVDGFDDALTRAFAPKDAQSRLRRLLQSDSGLMLIGAANSSDVQRDYDERLFQSFLEIDLPQVSAADALLLAGQGRGGRIVSIVVEFIGGSPRRVQIMLDALAREPELSASALVERLVGREESGFDAVLAGLPIRQRRVLDALLVGGEPNRPTGLAELLGTTQADIADAVSLLAAAKIIVKSKASTTRRAYYMISDRLLAFWYARQRGGPAYLADLTDIVAIGGDIGAASIKPKIDFAKDTRAASYRALETWLSKQSDLDVASKIVAASLVRAAPSGALEDAADLLSQRIAPQAATALLRTAAAPDQATAMASHPDIETAMALLRLPRSSQSLK